MIKMTSDAKGSTDKCGLSNFTTHEYFCTVKILILRTLMCITRKILRHHLVVVNKLSNRRVYFFTTQAFIILMRSAFTRKFSVSIVS
jgi:hypothetical protein